MMFLRCTGWARGGICEWVWLFVTLSWLLFLQLPAAATSLGGEFQVNTFTTGAQFYPAVAAAPSGDFVVVWESFGEDEDYFGIFAQRYASGGAALGSVFRVNTYTTGFQLLPVVARVPNADGALDFVVVWQSAAQDGSNFDVIGKRFDANGMTLGSEFRINDYTTDSQSDPAVAATSGGDFVVVWLSDTQDAGSSGIFGRRFASTGATLGSEFRVNTYTTGTQLVAAVAISAVGDFVVVWTSDGQDGSADGVFAQRYASSGAPAGSEFQVNTFTTNRQYAPHVAVAGNGDFVIVWHSYSQDQSQDAIVAQRYASSGSRLGSEFRVNTYTTAVQSFPEIAFAANGQFVVLWESFGQDGDSLGVFGQRHAGSGGRLGSEFQVNSYTTAQQSQPVVATAPEGEFVVVWASSPGQDGDGVGVFAQRFDASGCPAAPDDGCQAAGDGLLLVKPGKLIAKFLKGPARVQTDFGNPLNPGGTAYDLCIYDDDGTRVGALSVARAGETTCDGGSCWRPIGGDPPGGKGYKYKDGQLAAASVKQLSLNGGDAGNSKALVKAFPATASGIPAALQNASSTTIQLHGSDAAKCLTATLTDVKQSDGTTFKAK